MSQTSVAPKFTAAPIHAAGLVLGLAYLAGGFDGLMGSLAPDAMAGRRWWLAGVGLVYFARFLVTQFVMLKRAFPWAEAWPVGMWAAVLQLGLMWLGGQTSAPLSRVAGAGLVLYGIGSYLNTGSESERLRWKRKPENQGKLYTEGLFSRSVHINYWGDVVLFTGFAMMAGSWWAAIFPALMLTMFIGFHIPRQDAHMVEHYGQEFVDYAARTKKLVPHVY